MLRMDTLQAYLSTVRDGLDAETRRIFSDEREELYRTTNYTELHILYIYQFNVRQTS